MTLGRRGRIVVGAVALVGMLGCAACLLLSGSTATSRLADHFHLDDVSTEAAIESGLLAKLPLGSTENQVEDFLVASGIGADKLSSWYPPNKDGAIVCRIEYDVNTLEFVKESYCLLFKLDADRRLVGIDAKKWLTGL